MAGVGLLANDPLMTTPAVLPTDEEYIDYSSGFPIKMKRPKWGDIPEQAAPATPSDMTGGASAAVPFSGPAPFSMAGPPPPAPEPVAGPGGMPAPMPNAGVAPFLPNPDAGPGSVPPVGPPVAAPAAAAVAAATADDEDTPTAAKPVQMNNAPMSLAPAAPVAEPSLMDKISAGAKGISPALLGVGAALSGDNGATTRAIQKEQNDLAVTAASGNATATALAKKGASPEEIAAARANPLVMKSLVEQYLSKSKYKVQKTGQDEFGGEQYSAINENDPTDSMPLVNGVAVKPGTVAGSGTSAGPGAANAYLAKGTSAIDHAKVGDEYLSQFSPEAQAAVKDYIAGLATPTGNPRKGWAENIQKIAKKYGADIGVPVDDTTFAQRKTYRNELAKNSPNTAGGQVKAFSQLLEHMSSLADNIEKQGNVNGFGLPDVAEAANKIRQHSSNTNAAAARAVESDAQSAAGEIGKLFSGSQGGGVHERELTRNRFGSASSTPVSAAALESTLELAQGGLRALERRRDEILGEGRGPQFVGKAEQAKIDHIQGVVARLKGEQGAARSAVPSGTTSGGLKWSVVQ